MKLSKILMFVGVLLLAPLFFLPLWNITLEAPQYPIPLGFNIYINKFADVREHDLQNINLLNHYVGMEKIPEQIPEFKIFPYVVGGMILLGLIFAFTGNPRLYLLWFVVMVILGVIGMYDFYTWEYNYGHNLNPHAIMSFKNPDGTRMAYQPPLLGTKQILNFTAHSYPRIGAFLMFVGMGLTFLASIIGLRNRKH